MSRAAALTKANYQLMSARLFGRIAFGAGNGASSYPFARALHPHTAPWLFRGRRMTIRLLNDIPLYRFPPVHTSAQQFPPFASLSPQLSHLQPSSLQTPHSFEREKRHTCSSGISIRGDHLVRNRIRQDVIILVERVDGRDILV